MMLLVISGTNARGVEGQGVSSPAASINWIETALGLDQAKELKKLEDASTAGFDIVAITPGMSLALNRKWGTSSECVHISINCR